MNFLQIVESLALVAAAWLLWRRARNAEPRYGRALGILVLALTLHSVQNLLSNLLYSSLRDRPDFSVNLAVLTLLAVQIVRGLLLVWATYAWMVVAAPRLRRSWRGYLILLCVVGVVMAPDANFGIGILMIIPMLRLKWTENIHGWSRIGLVIAFGLLTLTLTLNVNVNVFDSDVLHIDSDFGGGGSAITQVDGELSQPAASIIAALRPWEHALEAMLVVLRLQLALAFLQLLVVPIRLRGLSLKRRFTVTLAMYRFIPGTLALIFMILIAYLGIGLHRVSSIRQTFDATLDQSLRDARTILESNAGQSRTLSLPSQPHRPYPVYALVRDMEWNIADADTTSGPKWSARTRAVSRGTPAFLAQTNFFGATRADSSRGLAESGGVLYLRAARLRYRDDRATACEVYVAVDTTYMAAIARRLQTDISVSVSPRVFIGGGSVQIVGDEEGAWADTSFTIDAPFARTVTRDDILETRLYLARSFLPIGDWLDRDAADTERIGAVQLKLSTTPRGLWESLTDNTLALTSQAFAIAILVIIAILFFIVELSAVRTGRSIVKGIVTDVKNLTVAAKKFGEGDLSHRVDLSGKDEMGQLAATFNIMASNIEQHQEVLREKERLEADLSLARDIQQRMLPQSAPVIPGLDVAGLSIPSKEVGGDLFYFLPVAGGRLGLTIGDVSGKSVPAALLMSNVLAALKSEARIVENEDEILNHLNRLIVEQVEPGRFVTFFYGVVDPEKKLVRYACAGHNPPLILRASGEAEWLEEAGVPLGVMAESTYAPVEAALEPGDVLVLYSDGVTEAQSAPPPSPADTAGDEMNDPPRDDEFFDEHRLESAVREARGRTATEIIAHVMDRIRTFTEGEEQSDDLTIVVVRVLA